MEDKTSASEKALKLTKWWISSIGQAQIATLTAMTRSMELMTNTYARLWGQPAKEVLPADRRFADDAWSENLTFDVMKQSYLISAQWMMDMVSSQDKELRVIPSTHVGLMASHRAKYELWPDLVDWLGQRSG